MIWMRWTALALATVLATNVAQTAKSAEPVYFTEEEPVYEELFPAGLPDLVPRAENAVFNSFGNPNTALVSFNVVAPRQLEETEEEAQAFGGSVAQPFDPETTSVVAQSLDVPGELTSGEVERTSPTDAATAIQDSPEIQTVNVQRRSSIAFDTRVRGYHLGQVNSQAEGVYLMPVRPDLDSQLSRVDPRLINRLDVISGPYSTRFGPGFAFVDADLVDTPRFEDGFESHNRLGYTYRGNGQQHYAVDTYYGGNCNYGFLMNYTYRNGADYRAGNGVRVPSSYLANNVSSQLGFNLAPETKVEMRYDFLDQRNTQIPGQFFDLDELETHNFLVSFIDEDCSACWTRLQTDAWYYRTPLRGTARNDSYFNSVARVERALETTLSASDINFNGTTDALITSAGGRTEVVYGEKGDVQLLAGVDVRHMRQNIDEHFDITGGALFPVDTQMPRSEMFNPGGYTELSLPMTGYWTARAGARVDYVHTLSIGQETRDNTLYAFYLMNDVQVTDYTTGTLGFGHAQRPPTLLERYSRGVFVSVLQTGLSRVLGDPGLAPERLWQIDAGLSSDWGDTRASANFYYSWINDYITFAGSNVTDPLGARLIQYFPTDLATLTGFEAKVERDLSSSWTTWVAGHYVHGTDETLGQPLWGISPLEGQLGLSYHHSENPDLWGIETIARFVDSQSRLGRIRAGSPPLFNQGLVPIESYTPAFVTVNIRGYWEPQLNNPRSKVRLIAGVENLLDATYLQHLDLRLPNSNGFDDAFALYPGITPYAGFDWTY